MPRKTWLKNWYLCQDFNPESLHNELEVLPSMETVTHFLCFRDTCHIPCVTALYDHCVTTV